MLITFNTKIDLFIAGASLSGRYKLNKEKIEALEKAKLKKSKPKTAAAEKKTVKKTTKKPVAKSTEKRSPKKTKVKSPKKPVSKSPKVKKGKSASKSSLSKSPVVKKAIKVSCKKTLAFLGLISKVYIKIYHDIHPAMVLMHKRNSMRPSI